MTMHTLFRIKICGVTNQRDAADVADSGADAIGLNFYPKSPRCVSIEMARRIAGELPEDIRRVGVFVNSPAASVNEIADIVGLDFAQLHGDETVEQIGDVEAVPVIKAIRCRADSLHGIAALARQCLETDGRLEAILLDAFVRGEFGGTGARTDWGAAARIRANLTIPLILAGGLTAENVADAIHAVSPAAVDVASGVESAPGKKDREAIRRFVDQARLAFNQNTEC
jgi:phosphoribosylanthranilate isomerase